MQTGTLENSAILFENISRISKLPLSTPTARFTLPTGQRLAYEEFGTRSGIPMLYFHDGGSSRLECAFFHRSARQFGFRLIAVDRPGIGCSDYYPAAAAADFCQDIISLTDYLGISKFGVMSLGAGGIYALTLAHLFPKRVTLHLSLAGIPGTVFNEHCGHSYAASCWNELTPPLVKFLIRIKHTFFPDEPEQLIERLEHYLSYTDRKTLANPRVMKTLALDQREATRAGYRGIAQDLAVCFRKLDFSLQEVDVPTVIWQGCADRMSKRADCEYMASRMPRAHFYRVPNRGHFFFIHSMDEVFHRLGQASMIKAEIAA